MTTTDSRKDYQRDWARHWRATNRDRYLATARAYRIRNRERILERTRRWQMDNPEKAAEASRQWKANNKTRLVVGRRRRRLEVRLEAMSAYGGPKCARCGFSDVRALQIDHINGNGAAQARELGGGGVTLYYWLRRNGYPRGYQVLCANCNWIKREEQREYGPKLLER